MESKQKELLMKLKALSETGVGGEKENAQELLQKYMRKYGITKKELEFETVKDVLFKFKNEREKMLLLQIVYKVTDSASWYFTYKGKQKISNARIVTCTNAQEVEIGFLFDFYNRLYKKEEERLFDAFVQKHRLFGTPPKDTEPGPFDEEEYERLIQMMKALSDETPVKQIEGSKQCRRN